jgi:ferredoxin-NADP reductase
VRDVEYLTTDIKQFTIEVSGDFSHQAGQWADVFMPEIDAVGGYTIASAPSQLSQAGTITLAIKAAAQHAPTEWMHRRATAGTELLLRPGGSFIYEAPVHGRAVLLVRHTGGPRVCSAIIARAGSWVLSGSASSWAYCT